MIIRQEIEKFSRAVHYVVMVALFFILPALLASCKGDEPYEEIDPRTVPVQIVSDVVLTQTDKGNLSMRMNSPVMERYEYVQDSVNISYEYYPDGFYVYAFTEDSQLETRITAKEAKHVTTKGEESWSVFGDVVVINYIKGEMMETDTIYWNQEAKMIHTDCYVRLSSYSGVMQGYGMESDERARNAVIQKPFDSYTIIRDSTDFYRDSANFVGPPVQRF